MDTLAQLNDTQSALKQSTAMGKRKERSGEDAAGQRKDVEP